MNTDVLIVGAGPTGLALAAQLIRFGVDFHIVDKKETTTPYSKAIGVQARTLEIYEQIGIADDLVSRGWIANKVKLLEGGEVRGQIDLSQIGEGMSPYPFLLIAEQGRHEALVYDRIRSMGKDVSWETELENFTHDETGVHARVRSASGETEEIGAKFLVGCDGAHSLVRHKLGIEFTGSTFERLFYVADVEIDWAFEHDALHANLGKDTLTAFFPMPGDRRWRIVGTFPEGHEKEEGEILYDEIERQIIADTDLKLDVTTVHWFSTYKVHSRHVGKFSSGRCHLAGDSAHIHTPAGAQGMNTGIQDSYNLAWKLAAVLKNGAPLSLLDTYNEERLPNAHRLLQTTDRFFQIAASDEPVTSFLRINVFPYLANFAFNLDMVKRAVFPLVSQIGINYRASSLSSGDGFKVKAGDRMPWFEIDGASVYDRLHEPMFHLIVFHDGISDVSPLPQDLMDEWKGRIDSTVIPLYPAIAEKFGARESFFVILRPDNYIGMISADFSPEAVEGYLGKFVSKAETRP
jgi:2-polyprenyl-6-methoxyphenol hydroxylase-like FAD-dependent oxidoreductase